MDEGGAGEPGGLRPLQWKNLETKQDGKLVCPVIASGGTNADFSGKS